MRSPTKILFAAVAAAAACAWAQAPSVPSPAPSAGAACADCGVVTSVRSVSKELRPSPADAGRPSGFVTSVPLGGGKASTGSSASIGKEAPSVVSQWQVIVRLDDGRYRLVVLDSRPDVAEGDRVRVEGSRIVRPADGKEGAGPR